MNGDHKDGAAYQMLVGFYTRHPEGIAFTMPDLSRRGSADGMAEFGVDFQEDCSGYEYDGVS